MLLPAKAQLVRSVGKKPLMRPSGSGFCAPWNSARRSIAGIAEGIRRHLAVHVQIFHPLHPLARGAVGEGVGGADAHRLRAFMVITSNAASGQENCRLQHEGIGLFHGVKPFQ